LLGAGYTWYGKFDIETDGKRRYVQFYKWDGSLSNWHAVKEQIVLDRVQAVFSGLLPDESVRPRGNEVFESLEATRR
jgi:hypothetical protein